MILRSAENSTSSSSPDHRGDCCILRVKHLGKVFGGEIVLNDVDLELHSGKVVLLDGENGAGKTTLINILTGNLEPDFGEIHYSANNLKISFTFPMNLLNRLNPINPFAPDTIARCGIQRTWQDVRLFASMNLRDNISIAAAHQPGENPILAMIGFGADHSLQLEKDVSATLKQLGLEGKGNSSGDMISLGQSKRVAIARAVAAHAKVLFLDEPLAGLDRTGIEAVLDLLRYLVEKHHITLVIVEHAFNQSLLRGLVTERWRLENGKLTVTQPEKSKVPIVSAPDWFQTLTNAADQVINEELPRGATLTRFRIKDRYKNAPVLEIRDLILKRGNRPVIGLDNNGTETGLSLTIFEGEIAVLQATNGWGKSTLVDAICKILPIANGTIKAVRGGELDRPGGASFHGMSILRSPPSLFPHLTVRDASRIAKSIPALPNLNGRVVSSLSGGERQRLALEMLNPNNVTILDEPFLNLDGHCAVLDRLLFNSLQTCFVLLPTFAKHCCPSRTNSD